MTLTAHGIVGGAIVSLMPAHPVIGLCLAFACHFLLDAIPHWEYPIQSDSVNPKIGAAMRYDRALLIDMLTIGFDGALGVACALLLFATRDNIALVASGACAAIFPDVLQFVYTRFPHEPLSSLQRFHEWAHSSTSLNTRPIFGIASQATLIFVIAIIVRTANLIG